MQGQRGTGCLGRSVLSWGSNAYASQTDGGHLHVAQLHVRARVDRQGAASQGDGHGQSVRPLPTAKEARRPDRATSNPAADLQFFFQLWCPPKESCDI